MKWLKTLSIALAGVIIASSILTAIPVQAFEPAEVTSERTLNTKTYWLGDNKYATYSMLSPLHYWEDNQWKDINNSFEPSDAPWNWQMVDNDYNVRAKDDFTSGQIIEFERNGQTIQYQPMALEWTNDLGMIQQISMPQDVTSVITNPESYLTPSTTNNLGKIKWYDAYGAGIDFEWQCNPTVLDKNLIIESLNSLPDPLQYIIDGGNPTLRLNMIFSPSADLDIYVNDTLWDKKVKVTTFDAIDFRYDGETLWQILPLVYEDTNNSIMQSVATLEKSGNNLYISIRVPYDWLQTANFPVIIDADTGVTYPGTASQASVGVENDEEWHDIDNIKAAANVAYANDLDSDQGEITYQLYATNFGFAVDGGATIDGIFVEINRYCFSANEMEDYRVQLLNAAGVLDGDDKASASKWPTVAATETYGGVADDWNITPTPAMVNDADFGVCLSARPTVDNNEFALVYYIRMTVYFTLGGVVLPTVTAQIATNVEDTTATGNGNITNTGGENCDIRGIVWDLATHADPGNVAPGASGYANDIHSHNGFGVGAFTESLTGLPTGDIIYYRAYAHNSAGYDYSNTEQNFLTKPAAPTNVSATDGAHENKVTITWTKSTGATDYHVWRGAVDLGAAGDVATFDDAGATAATITNSGTVTAGDGASTLHVTLSLAGEATGTTVHSYKVVASNATGDSDDSAADNGNRGVGAITYQWQRSAGDADAAYGNIAGATTDPYNDTAAPAPTITPGAGDATDGTSALHSTLSVAGETGNDGAGRWYRCVVSASGASNSPQNSDTNRGYRGTAALGYEWYRSAADADAAYGSILGEGGVTDPYNDTNAVVDPDGRWYYCEITMSGAAAQDTTHDRGNKSAAPDPPTNFTATYITDTQVTLTWTTGAGATDTYIRGKHGSYPVDRTDGYLVYDGALETEDDVTMDFDILPEAVYYRGWGENAGTYSVTYAEDYTGGMTMTFMSLLALGGIMSFLSFKSRYIAMKFLAGFAWLPAVFYNLANPVTGTATGDPVNTALTLVLFGVVFLLPFIGAGQRQSTNDGSTSGVEKAFRSFLPKITGDSGRGRESTEEYRQRVNRALHQRRKRGE